MIIAIAAVFSRYAGYAAWPWLVAALAGALAGYRQVSLGYYRSAWRDLLDRGDRSAQKHVATQLLIGSITGAGVASGICAASRWFAG